MILNDYHSSVFNNYCCTVKRLLSQLIIHIILSKKTTFIICYKNEFNYSSVFNDFSRVSFITIVMAVYLMFNGVPLNDYDGSVCNN